MKIKAFALPVGEDKYEDTIIRMTYKHLRKSNSRVITRLMIISMIDIGRRHERTTK